MQNENLIWNYEKYRQIVKSYRGKKTDDGITLINLSFVYEYLARTTRIATDSAFQSWAKKSSPGPTQSSLMQLEKYWNTCLTIEKENQNKEKKTMSHYNQFVAEHTYNIIKIIKNFIHSEEVDDEDTFLQMTHSIEVESFCIPEELECMFNDYIDEKPMLTT